MASYLAAAEALHHLKIPSSRVRSTGVDLGRGSYGKVFEVEYDGKLCASKEVHRWMMELPSAEEQSRIKDDFLRECHLWSTLRHPNVVLFLGIYYPSSDESLLPVMVMEKMQESVTSLVDKHDDIPLLVKLSILHDVSLGLRYLHGHNPPIIHRDLSPNNILVTSHLEAKITDLGVAKAMTMGPTSKTLTITPGTGVFMPPEALDDKPVYGPPLDVFSFGGVILHITSRQWPTPKSWSQIIPKTRKRIILSSEVERRQQYIDMMSGSNADLKPLVVSCLEDDPELRPSAADMSERIKMMKEEYSKKTTRDGMDPISWLGEIKQTSTQLQQQLVVKESTMPDLFSGPVNIKWEEGASAPVGRLHHTAVLCNGVIYVGGGFTTSDDGKTQLLSTLDIYHPDTNTWNTIDTPQNSFTVTVLNGKIAIVGGINNSEVTNKVLVLESGQWKDYTEMPTPRYDVTAISHQQMLIVMGGSDDGGEVLGTTELFDATTGQWFKCDDLPQPLQSSQSVIVGDTVFVLSGHTKDGNFSKAVYAAPLDTLSSHQLKWGRLVDTPCSGPAAVGLNNKYLLAVGGDGVYTLNSTATTWVTTAPLPEQKINTAVVCDDDACRLVMIGGYKTNKVWIGSF